MTQRPIDRFMSLECTSEIRRWLESASADNQLRWKQFNFNLFDVTIDKAKDEVLLEDVVLESDETVQKLSIREFSDALIRRTA